VFESVGVRMYVCMYVYIHTFKYVRIKTCMYTCVHLRVCVGVYIYFTYVGMYIYMCMHIYICASLLFP